MQPTVDKGNTRRSN